jgi:GDPmannose 4,6-dehydratase
MQITLGGAARARIRFRLPCGDRRQVPRDSAVIAPVKGRTALVTGITGQDGSYLAELLLDKGYEVHGVIRRSSSFNTARIDHLFRDSHEPQRQALHLHYGDLSDGMSLRAIVERVQPDEVYNLGAQSHVRVSFDQPEYTADIDALGALRLLEALRDFRLHSGKEVRLYQASSSEMFGSAPPPQNERTPFHPRSPYGVAKAFAFWQAVNYREAYGMYVTNGILFNHESPRRGETFVTRKITRAAARIKLGLQEHLYLGNLEARRDWGHAKDFVEAMWLMLQQPAPDDFVIATGTTVSVREFAERVFSRLGLDWERHVRHDPRYLRPSEVDVLQGDASKARAELGWSPRHTLDDLIADMLAHDLELARREKLLREHGAAS